MKKNNFSKRGFTEEYLQNGQILEEFQVNNRISINIILYLRKQYKKLFYLLKRNNFLYFPISIKRNFTVMRFYKKYNNNNNNNGKEKRCKMSE
ncbi:MAG: hypothetical protein ACR2F1_00425 [Nitrososphaeraceae archaeon]